MRVRWIGVSIAFTIAVTGAAWADSAYGPGNWWVSNKDKDCHLFIQGHEGDSENPVQICLEPGIGGIRLDSLQKTIANVNWSKRSKYFNEVAQIRVRACSPRDNSGDFRVPNASELKQNGKIIIDLC